MRKGRRVRSGHHHFDRHSHPVQQPADDLLVALVRGVLQQRHAVLVLYVRANFIQLVELLQPVEIVVEYRFDQSRAHLH